MRWWRGLAACLVVFAGAGCAHVRPEPTAACRLRALPLNVSQSHPTALTAPQKTFQDELGELLSAPRRTTPGALTAPLEVLVLSGGSQNGAFGAGLAYGLGRHPKYDVVTGISTGALLSTLIFLAKDPPPGDRDYPAVKPGLPYQGARSNVEDLIVAYAIEEEGELLKTGSSQLYDGLVKGAVGSLTPLRARLLRFLTQGTLEQLKAARAEGRRLYVGVTDVDDGRAYALELTEVAARLRPDSTPAEVRTLRECYVDALVASSSVPIAAEPVTLNIRLGDGAEKTDLFVDGGVRYGVFLRQVAPNEGSAPPINVTLVVNGKLYSRPWSEGGGRPETWSAITLALRSVDLLKNQVYRFSVEDVERLPRNGGELKMAFISNEGLSALPGDPDEHVFQGRTCRQWKEHDRDTAKPVEFHPAFMACLIDYGVARGRQDPWNLRCADPADCRAQVARLP